MEDFSQHIEMLIDSCKSTIEQMTNIKINNIDKSLVLEKQGIMPFAHIIAYKDYDNEIDGEFILGFESTNDALKLSSAIGEKLGIGKFEKISEDSTDLLNEFLNIVVGRTISDWDGIGLKVKFDTPIFKKKYESNGSKHLNGYIITLDVTSDTVNLDEDNPVDQILLRVNFVEKVENKIENKTILLAEDSKVMRTIIGKILKGQGAKIKEAKDGEEAVKFHKLYKPDLTLMDINMPKLSGLEAIAQIREVDSNSKFMILSSSSRKDEIICAKTLKVSGYLVKPMEPEKLIERVSAVF